jgi:hypothetical protein
VHGDLSDHRALNFESMVCRRHLKANAEFSKLSAEQGFGDVDRDCLLSPRRKQAMQERGERQMQWRDECEEGASLQELRLFEKQPQAQHLKPFGAPPLHPSMKGCPNFFKMSFGQTLEMLRLCKGPGLGREKNFRTPEQRVDREFERGEIILVPESSIPYSAGGIDAPEGYFDDMDEESLSFANSTEREDRVDFSSTQVFLMLTLGKWFA